MFDSLNVAQKGEWYVIRVISGTEENVRSSLMQRREAFNLENHILEVFIPTHDTITVRANGEKIKKPKNIFPGYILVKMVVTNESWYIVRNTPNVTGFLGAGTIPVPVSGAELDQLKGSLAAKNTAFSIKFQIGEFVIIKSGAFEGSEGKITEINEEKGLVKVEINILGRDTLVEIDFTNVKPKK